MNIPECFHRSKRQLRRGVYFFSLLSVILAGLSGWFFCLPDNRPWALVLFLTGLASFAALKHICKRLNLVCSITNKPELVYWMHPVNRMGVMFDEESEQISLMALHLKNGMKVELGVKYGEREHLIGWIKEKNASIRYGNYEE